MLYCFDLKNKHMINAANKNVYMKPADHPSKRMQQHDFVYIQEGEWEIGLEDEIFRVKKDDVVILPANLYHYGVKKCAEKTKTMFLFASLMEGDGFLTGKPKSVPPGKVYLPSCISASENPQIQQCFIDIIAAKQVDADLRASVLFDWLLVLLCEEVQKYESKDKLAPAIKLLIDSNLHLALTNTYIAQKMNISVRTAEMRFKEYYDITIHQYICKQKIKRANNYLENYPKMKLCEIATSLGFYDEYHFSRQYKKYVGISPREYRKRMEQTELITCV